MKLLIIDDHQMVLAGIAAVLQQPRYQVQTLLAKDIAEGIAFIHSNPDIDAILLDIALPEGDSISALARLGEARADLPVIILSASESFADVRRAFAAGALGYVPKSATAETLMSAVRLVLAGEIYVPPIVLREPPDSPQTVSRTQPSGLTLRQAEILKLLARGLSNKEIGRELDLSERTVKAHVTGIFKSLGVTNRMEASKYAPRDTDEDGR